MLATAPGPATLDAAAARAQSGERARRAAEVPPPRVPSPERLRRVLAEELELPRKLRRRRRGTPLACERVSAERDGGADGQALLAQAALAQAALAQAALAQAALAQAALARAGAQPGPSADPQPPLTPGPAGDLREAERVLDPRLRPELEHRVGRIFADAEALGELAALALPELARRALFRAARCRTPALGGAVEGCQRCGFSQRVHRSCGDRHCPQCLLLDGERWLRAELSRALAVAYYHVVLTLPPALRVVAARSPAHKQAAYGLLFRAARAAIEATARAELDDPRAQLALTLVLHTWNGRFAYHPHVHAIVSAGALSGGGADEERWLEPRPGRSLLPTDALRVAFRAALVAETRAVAQGDALEAKAKAKAKGLGLSESEAEALIEELASEETYQHAFAKATLDPELALRYLARYVSRVGFNNRRLISYEPAGAGWVVYRAKDGQEVGCTRVQFVERFAAHVLPRGFHRVRRYGLIATRGQKERLERARAAIAREHPERAPARDEGEGENPGPDPDPAPAPAPLGGSFVERFYLEQGVDLSLCPRCQGRLHRWPFDPVRLGPDQLHPRPRLDSS